MAGNKSRIFQWTTVCLTFVFVVIRLYIRFPRRFSKGALLNLDRLSDLLIVFAWLSYLDQASLDIVLSTKTAFFEDIWAPGVPVEERSLALKVFYVECITYLNCMYAVKASILILYHQSFPTGYEHWKWLRRCLVAVDCIVALGWVAYILSSLLACRPLWTNWTTDPEKYCAYYNFKWYLGLAYGLHICTDILVYILPFFFIGSLHKPGSVKLGLVLTFGVGFLCVACAIITEVGFFILLPPSKVFFITSLEQSTAITAGCLPAFRAILEAWHYRGRTLPVSTRDTEQRDPRGSTDAFNPKDAEATKAGGLGPGVVLAEARKHADWMRGVVVKEHLARSELTSQQEDQALGRAKMEQCQHHLSSVESKLSTGTARSREGSSY